ncbi:MAG: hypothetical protein AB1753_07115, partial [Thermoproteota archaeon]
RDSNRTIAAILIFGGVPGAALLVIYLDRRTNGKVSRILHVVASAMPRRGFRVKGGGGGGSSAGGGAGR